MKNKKANIDWVTMKQNEIIRCHDGTVALIYNDLIDLDDIEDDNTEIVLQLVDNIQLNFKAHQIVNVNGVCITYEKTYDTYDNKTINHIVHVSMDKIIYSCITNKND